MTDGTVIKIVVGYVDIAWGCWYDATSAVGVLTAWFEGTTGAGDGSVVIAAMTLARNATLLFFTSCDADSC